MKNLIATAGCALVIGLSSTFAQQDSTRDREQAKRVKQPNETNRSRYQRTDETRKSSANSNDQNQNNTKSNDQNQSNTKREMVIVQPSEVPSSLRETLADPKYQGWENAVIYHNTRTGEYLVSPRPHRFSSEGKEVSYDMTGNNRSGKSYGNTGNQDRSNGSVNQHRRMSGNSTSGNNSRTSGDNSNASSSTNQNQDSTGMSQRQSSSSSSQDRERSGQSSSYRRDSTQMNRTNSGNSQDRNSDRTRSRSDSSRTNGGNNSNASSGTTSSNNSYSKNRVEDKNLPTEGMVLVEEQDVPAKLKETLRDSDYSGWERGKLYQNPATGEYILVMGGSESGNDEQRSYRFDKDGKVIKDSKMNGRGQE
jgi:hypothetical protein